VSIRVVVVLPEPFGPQVANDFARAHLETHVVDDRDPGEALDEVDGLEHGQRLQMDSTASTRRATSSLVV
jgi:hypothetical protein